jgi:hypothetical protein
MIRVTPCGGRHSSLGGVRGFSLSEIMFRFCLHLVPRLVFLRRVFLYQVMDIPHALFEEKLEAMKVTKGLRNDIDLSASDLKELVGQYKDVYVEAKGEQFPSGMLIWFHALTCHNSVSKLKLCFFLIKIYVYVMRSFSSCRTKETT